MLRLKEGNVEGGGGGEWAVWNRKDSSENQDCGGGETQAVKRDESGKSGLLKREENLKRGAGTVP